MLNILKFLKGKDCIGIDLGTTNSCAAYLNEKGEPETILNAEGKRVTPSVVGYAKDGSLLVGDAALRQAVSNPANTIYSSKRFMGCTFEERKTEAFSVPFVVRPDKQKDDAVSFEINARLISPEEVAAEILGKLRRDAEEFLGKRVHDCVITVPAYFNEVQRKATMHAGEIAGLNVIKIINEPTAAALAYAKDLDSNQTIVVYDFGGGTMDVTVLETNDGETLKVVATGGDSHLGGDNVDELMMQQIITAFSNETGFDLTKSPQSMQRLKQEVVNAKIELSNVTKVDISLPFLAEQEGKPLHLQHSFEREQFEKDIEPIIEKTISITKQVLEESGRDASKIDDVILVGGSTRIPMVKEKLKKLFKKDPRQNIATDELVAHGAAIQGAIVKGDDKKVSSKLIDVVSVSLGVELIGDRSFHLIKKNTELPASVRDEFETAFDNQVRAEIVVLQGEDPTASKNKKLQRFYVEDIEPAPKGQKKIFITYTLDSDGILNVEAVDENGKKKSVSVNDDGLLDKSQIDNRAKEHSMPEKKRQALQLEKAKLGDKIAKAEKAMEESSDSKEQEDMKVLIEEGQQKLQESVDSKKIAEFGEKIDKAVPEEEDS